MKTDVFTIPENATVADAMRLFVENHISAAPIVNDQNEAIGFISDGDILKRLSPRASSFMDPIVMTMSSVRDDRDYNERLEYLMNANVREIGVGRSIGVNVDADLPEVCRVLADHHLKKVPVLKDGRIVGIINRSDITQYSMEAYLRGHGQDAVYCEPDDEMADGPTDAKTGGPADAKTGDKAPEPTETPDGNCRS